MHSRSTTTTITPANTIALNSASSIVASPQALPRTWWSEAKIQAQVNRNFIYSKLKSEHRRKLHQQVFFGKGLTNDKYIDWILTKTRRFFLIMVEIGVPEHIFAAIDDAWDDGDLPIPLAQLPTLTSSWKKDEAINQKFYSTQFACLLRPLSEKAHVAYGPNEFVPLECVDRPSPAGLAQPWLKVHLPDQPSRVFTLKKFRLGISNKLDPQLEAAFLADMRIARLVPHKHIASVWASYTVKASGFVLINFDPEHTLKSFIRSQPPASSQPINKNQRNETVLTWFHCLAHALAAIHEQGLCHSAISPSNIVIDAKNQIAFSDIASLKILQEDMKITDINEAYNYSAPEKNTWKSLLSPKPSRPLPLLPQTGDSTSQRVATLSQNKQSPYIESVKSNPQSHTLDQAFFTLAENKSPGLMVKCSPTNDAVSCTNRPQTPASSRSFIDSNSPLPPPKDNIPSLRKVGPAHVFNKPTNSAPNSDLLCSLQTTSSASASASAPPPPPTPPPTASAPPPPPPPATTTATAPASSTRQSRKTSKNYVDQRADVFSLGCVFIDLLTYMIKDKHEDFAQYRSAKRHADAAFDMQTTAPVLSPVRPKPPQAPDKPHFDASFHNNLGQVTSWTDILNNNASTMHAQTYRAVPQLIRLTRSMLSSNQLLRPSAAEVRDRLLEIFIDRAGLHSVCCQSAGRTISSSSSFSSSSSLSSSLMSFPAVPAPLALSSSISLSCPKSIDSVSPASISIPTNTYNNHKPSPSMPSPPRPLRNKKSLGIMLTIGEKNVLPPLPISSNSTSTSTFAPELTPLSSNKTLGGLFRAVRWGPRRSASVS